MRTATAIVCLSILTMSATAQEVRLDNLNKGDTVHGFRVAAVYLNDAVNLH